MKAVFVQGVLLNWSADLENVQLVALDKISETEMLRVAQAAAIYGWAYVELPQPGTGYHALVVAYRDDGLNKVWLNAYRREPPRKGATAAPASAAEAERVTTGSPGLPVDVVIGLVSPVEACARYSGPRRHRA